MKGKKNIYWINGYNGRLEGSTIFKSRREVVDYIKWEKLGKYGIKPLQIRIVEVKK